jgi:hypothetical protein
MESLAWLTSLLVILFLLLAGTLIFLFVAASRQQRRLQEEHSSAMAKTLEISLLLSERSQEQTEDVLRSAAQTSRDFLKETTERVWAEMERAQALTQKSMDLSLTRALDGSNKSQERIASTLSSAIAMLGTKDTLAYHQVNGSSIPLELGGEPYTAADDTYVANLAQRQADLEAADAALALINSLGVPGGSGGSGPYSGPLEV